VDLGLFTTYPVVRASRSSVHSIEHFFREEGSASLIEALATV
jgi:hypothetical protein